ncbi:hypothetical protein RND71_024962 [Anisodus tanguticus]|uniref:Uncharacterized protein n=1 Tax=Anisodus tanguticus TaxID=243964 RepID=A0AAE1V9Z1_9SOLA|nr:hypothetical protein RND71_024962 [Anisodus tanguticus]
MPVSFHFENRDDKEEVRVCVLTHRVLEEKRGKGDWGDARARWWRGHGGSGVVMVFVRRVKGGDGWKAAVFRRGSRVVGRWVCLGLFVNGEWDKGILGQGNVRLIFTKGDLKEVSGEVSKYKVGGPARVGLVAPIDVVVPPGNTGLDPSQTSIDVSCTEVSAPSVSVEF